MASTADTARSAVEEEQQSLEAIMKIMAARATGKATDDDVETAIDKALGKSVSSSMGQRKNADFSNEGVETIVEDMDNYDDEDEGDEEEENNDQALISAAPKRKLQKVYWDEAKHIDTYSDIPLGLSGARMIITFGGCPSPNCSPPLPQTVSAVLDGTREKIRFAIRDARHLHRKRQKTFRQAYAVVAHGSAKPGDTRDEWTPEVMYGVHRSGLSWAPKCGFAIEDLNQLFPEETRVYMRWEKSYDEYDASNDAASEDDAVLTHPDEQDHEVGAGGHIHDRIAHFDSRTLQMKKSKYLEFAEVRKGSFLTRGKTTEEAINDTAWGNLSLRTIRFLHWIGFEPNSPLHPPNEAMAQVLAFLAYDIFGRIVEKAVLLRLEREGKDRSELGDGEQLSVSDVKIALQDPEIKPATLFGGGEEKSSPQLYFGPGFENRLEMELEHLLGPPRQDNDELLSKHKADADLFRDLEVRDLDGIVDEISAHVRSYSNDKLPGATPTDKQANSRKRLKTVPV